MDAAVEGDDAVQGAVVAPGDDEDDVDYVVGMTGCCVVVMHHRLD